VLISSPTFGDITPPKNFFEHQLPSISSRRPFTMSANLTKRIANFGASNTSRICQGCRQKIAQTQQKNYSNALRPRLEPGLRASLSQHAAGLRPSQRAAQLPRSFSTTRPQNYKTVEEARSRYRSGVCSNRSCHLCCAGILTATSLSPGQRVSSSSPLVPV